MRPSKNRIYNQIILLCIVFIAGFILLISNHFLLLFLINKLDKRIDNERARIAIGKEIVTNIDLIERNFYKMTTTFEGIVQKKILEETHLYFKTIRQSFFVLQNGGVVTIKTMLNLENISEMTTEIIFHPDVKKQYTLEIIDLKPKLIEIENKFEILAQMLSKWNHLTDQVEDKLFRQSVISIKIFLKSIPSHFVRMRENANRLYYNGTQKLKNLQEEIIRQKDMYKKLEFMLALIIISGTIFILFRIGRGINQTWHMATHDPLTHLPNRTLLADRINLSINHARRNKSKIAVLYLDLDSFKPINDSLGHKAGDEVLQKISRRLIDLIRASDTVARVGGDEFVIALNEIKCPSDAALVAGKIIETINIPVIVEESTCHLGVSIGISLYPDHGHGQETLLKYADHAMYQAKKNYNNKYVFFDFKTTAR